jgi:thiol-disulfide isomerase/thioredoxin
LSATPESFRSATVDVSMSTGGYVLLAAVALAVAFGCYRALVDGRFRGTHAIKGADELAEAPLVSSVLDDTRWANQLGERATFVQFSSAFCAPCRATRRILENVVSRTPGVTHIEIDAEHHLDVVRRLGILRTPTTLILDGDGREIFRAAGAPTEARVMQALDLASG